MVSVDLVAQAAARTAAGVELQVRSPWYRSLPLSSIDLALSLDGTEVPADRIRFCVNDHDYALDELRERFEEFWFVLDAAAVRVSSVAPGKHEVDLHLSLRIPYLFDEETGAVLTIRPHAQLTITVPEDYAR